MKAAGRTKRSPVGWFIALAIIAAALLIGVYVIRYSTDYPSTTDATIDADMVHVAATVGGRIVTIGVEENATVKKDDVLFEIDPDRYRASLQQAEADLALARASLTTKGKAVETQNSTAVVAKDQVRRAAYDQALAQRTVDRLRPLVANGYIPRQQFDQSMVSLSDATTSLVQAREQSKASRNAVDTIASAQASVRAQEATVTLAKKALSDSIVKAPHDGRIVGLAVRSGEVVNPSQTLFTLVASDKWYAVGNFRETLLRRIHVGDCATVFSLIDRDRPLWGRVEGIGSGVLDDARIDVPRSVPYVQRELNWVRVEQRFPVRIRISNPPADLVRAGASAIIEVRHGAACH